MESYHKLKRRPNLEDQVPGHEQAIKEIELEFSLFSSYRDTG